MTEDLGSRPEFGHPIPLRRETELVTQTLEEGRLVRMDWNPKKREYFDIQAPLGLVVRWVMDDQPRITKGRIPSRDRMWRHFEVVKSPDPRIKVGDIAWQRDEKGQFKNPVMHPDFQETRLENLTLGLK